MSSGFKGYHPLVNVLFFISIIAFGMLLRHPVYLVISFISSTAYYLKLSGKDGRKTVFRFLLPMLLFVVIINSFFNHYRNYSRFGNPMVLLLQRGCDRGQVHAHLRQDFTKGCTCCFNDTSICSSLSPTL